MLATRNFLSITRLKNQRLVTNAIRIANRLLSNSRLTSLINTEHAEIINSMLVCEDFLSAAEENSLFDEIEPYIKRLRYEFDHWDDVIAT